MASHSASRVRAWVRRSIALSLGKHLFNGVKVRAVRGQVTQRSARRFDGWLDFGDFVRTEVVHHYDIARTQRGCQKLLDPGYKGLAVDRYARSEHMLT